MWRAKRRAVWFIAERQQKQSAVFIRPAPDQRGLKRMTATAAVPHHQPRAGQGFFADLHVRDHAVCRFACHVGQHPFDQQFQLPAACFFAKETRVHHLRVVKHQQVTSIQQTRQVTEDAVHRLQRVARVKQARAAAFG